MSLRILIATPIRSFGELISQVLQEVGYYPLLVADVANALDAIRVENVTLAVIDCKMPPPGTEFLATALRDQMPDLPLLFLHPDDSCNSAFTISSIDRKLPQPFYLPDLLATVEKMLPVENQVPKREIPTQPTDIPTELQWLKDVNRAAQYLTLLSLEADAQAAIIIRNSKIWAYAGQLPQNGAEELAHLIGQYWAGNDTEDLTRFVRLKSTGTEFMLYATGIGSGFVLTLAFEAEMPFSKMRMQAGEIARKLTSPIPELTEIKTTPNKLAREATKPDPAKNTKPPDVEEFSADDWIPEESLLDDGEDIDPEDELLAQQTAMFEELLASIDIPDPDGVGSQKARAAEKTPDFVVIDTDVESPKSEGYSIKQFGLESVFEPEQKIKDEVRSDADSSALHDLAYTCVLIPRLPEHLLSRDLGTLLNQSVSRLCLAYGWRLEHLAVRPQYLHWVVNVSPDVSPAKVIRIIREKTSEIIFEERPTLGKENPSGDFWAPGFMVLHGRSLTGERLQEYLHRTRNHQGIDPAQRT